MSKKFSNDLRKALEGLLGKWRDSVDLGMYCEGFEGGVRLGTRDCIEEVEILLASLPAQSGERGIEGRARELLEIGKSLLELDEEANSLGTDSWAWLRQVEDFLAASSNPASVQASLESMKLEIRKQAFEEAAEHRPFEYDGREWDWECECGAHGHWSGDDNWKTHVLAQATAPAVNEYPEKKP